MNNIALTVDEFCKAAGIGRTRAYAEIADGRLRPLKCGRRTLIPASELEAWLRRLPEVAAPPRAAGPKARRARA